MPAMDFLLDLLAMVSVLPSFIVFVILCSVLVADHWGYFVVFFVYTAIYLLSVSRLWHYLSNTTWLHSLGVLILPILGLYLLIGNYNSSKK